MTKRTISFGKHLITIDHSIGGKTVVYYDGRQVVSGGGFFSLIQESFVVAEDGENIIYDISERMGAIDSHYTLRRNGIVIFQS